MIDRESGGTESLARADILPRKRTEDLTDREAEIMAVLWQMGQASVEDIRQRLEGRPAASTVPSLSACKNACGNAATKANQN